MLRWIRDRFFAKPKPKFATDTLPFLLNIHSSAVHPPELTPDDLLSFRVERLHMVDFVGDLEMHFEHRIARDDLVYRDHFGRVIPSVPFTYRIFTPMGSVYVHGLTLDNVTVTFNPERTLDMFLAQ